MNKNPFVAQLCWTGGGFVFAFFAVGIPWWSIPYDQSWSGVETLFFWVGLFSVMMAAAFARIFGRAGFYLTIPFIGASVPAAIFARVLVDTIRNPTTHNLWPFEIAIGVAYGVFFAGLGAVLGTLFAWFTKKMRS
jgi:hypothetical protein